MSIKSLYRTGLGFAILMSLGWIAWLAGSMSLPDTSGLGPAAALLARVEASWAISLSFWGGVLGALCTIPAYLVYLVGFGRKAPVLLIPVAFAVVGAVFVALAYLTDIGSLAYTYAPALSGKSAAEADQLAATAEIAVNTIEIAWDFGSFLAYGLAMLWSAILLLRVDGVPKWISIIGIVGGLAGFVWLADDLMPFDLPLALAWVVVNVLAAIVWMVALSAVLARRDEPLTEPEGAA